MLIMNEFEKVFKQELISIGFETFGTGSKDSEGNMVAGIATTGTFKGIPPQPVNSNAMTPQVDGKRVQDGLVTFSAQKLNSDKGGDIVLWEDVRYRVTQVDHNQHFGGHYKIQFTKILAGE